MAIAADCKSAPSGFGGSSPPPPTSKPCAKGVAAEFLCKPRKRNFFPTQPETREIFKAEVAQLVEHQPSKLRVASSNLVFRSNKISRCSSGVERILGKDEVMSSIPITGSFFGFMPF